MTTTTETYKAALGSNGITHRGMLLRFRLVKPFLTGGSLLDVGAADGSMLELLRPYFLNVCAIDSDPAFRSDKVMTANVEDIPFWHDTFSTVLCSACRKHVNNSFVAMMEMVRVLSPGGHLIVIDPNPLLVRIGMLLGKFDKRYIRRLDWASKIAAEMEQCGLSVIHKSNGIFVVVVGKK